LRARNLLLFRRGKVQSIVANASENLGETQCAIGAVVDHVEAIKISLKDLIGDLSKTIDLLKAAEKERKATLKEVETVRATLRSLQKVDL
jgi:ABC-type transporter Mla subunit MlaD